MHHTRFIVFVLSVLSVLVIVPVFASTTDGSIDATNRYAWSETIGWIDFGTAVGNVHVTDAALTGYAWNETTGWISLNCSNDASCGTVNYNVTNTNAGVLGGNAWSENVGWIQFAPTNGGVTIDRSGFFSGYAWGENVGWIVFNCNNQTSCGTVSYKVSTDWRPANMRTPAASQPIGGRRGSRVSPVLTIPSTPAPSSASSPAVLMLTNMRERLLQRIERRLEDVTSFSAQSILEGMRERLLERINARIRSMSVEKQ